MVDFTVRRRLCRLFVDRVAVFRTDFERMHLGHSINLVAGRAYYFIYRHNWYLSIAYLFGNQAPTLYYNQTNTWATIGIDQLIMSLTSFLQSMPRTLSWRDPDTTTESKPELQGYVILHE